jgi:integrase
VIYKRGCDKKGAEGTCSKCGKRGSYDVYWYKFMWQGRLVRESTKQGNDKIARQMEAAHRTSLAKGEVGIRDKKPIPTLGEFSETRFKPWLKSNFEKAYPTTFRWYGSGVRALLSYKPLAGLRLNEINGERASEFAALRQAKGLQTSYINGSLRVLRRMTRLAVEWGVLESAPKIEMMPGERRRERVITPEEEARYLGVSAPLLSSIATVLVDTGLRPDECYRLRWEDITWSNGRNGTLLVTHGKTASARRVLPMAPRVRAILEKHWTAQSRPLDGWVWPAPTNSGHAETCSIRKQHLKALGLSGVRPFVLYSLRHTFLTRLGASGCDAWTLARIAGHSSIAISSRYVHPSEDAMLAAISRLSGHNSGHNGNLVGGGNSHSVAQLSSNEKDTGGPARI